MKKKYKDDLFPPDFYFKNKHIPLIDQFYKIQFDTTGISSVPGMYTPAYIITKAKRLHPRDYDAYMSALAISPLPFLSNLK